MLQDSKKLKMLTAKEQRRVCNYYAKNFIAWGDKGLDSKTLLQHIAPHIMLYNIRSTGRIKSNDEAVMLGIVHYFHLSTMRDLYNDPKKVQQYLSLDSHTVPVETNNIQLAKMLCRHNAIGQIANLSDTEIAAINAKSDNTARTIRNIRTRLAAFGFIVKTEHLDVNGQPCETGRGNFILHISKKFLFKNWFTQAQGSAISDTNTAISENAQKAENQSINNFENSDMRKNLPTSELRKKEELLNNSLNNNLYTNADFLINQASQSDEKEKENGAIKQSQEISNKKEEFEKNKNSAAPAEPINPVIQYSARERSESHAKILAAMLLGLYEKQGVHLSKDENYALLAGINEFILREFGKIRQKNAQINLEKAYAQAYNTVYKAVLLIKSMHDKGFYRLSKPTKFFSLERNDNGTWLVETGCMRYVIDVQMEKYALKNKKQDYDRNKQRIAGEIVQMVGESIWQILTGDAPDSVLSNHLQKLQMAVNKATQQQFLDNKKLKIGDQRELREMAAALMGALLNDRNFALRGYTATSVIQRWMQCYGITLNAPNEEVIRENQHYKRINQNGGDAVPMAAIFGKM